MRYICPDYGIKKIDRREEWRKKFEAHNQAKVEEAKARMESCKDTNCPECPSDCFGDRIFKRQAF